MAEAKPISPLEFEKPLVELEKKIEEIRKLSGKQKLGGEADIASLQKKLQEARRAVKHLVDNLEPQDRLALVTFSHGARTVAPPTAVTDEGRLELHRDPSATPG
jgi:acetyl-CoA carboxylase alpha subunit